MYTKYKSVTVTTITAWTIAVLIIICAVALPYLVNIYINERSVVTANDPAAIGKLEKTEIMLYICLYSSAVAAMVGICLLLKLLNNVRRNEVFVDSNVKYLRVISWCCFAAALMYFILGFFVLFSFVIAAAAAFIGLVVRVVKNLMKEAVDIKRENDLTI